MLGSFCLENSLTNLDLGSPDSLLARRGLISQVQSAELLQVPHECVGLHLQHREELQVPGAISRLLQRLALSGSGIHTLLLLHTLQ